MRGRQAGRKGKEIWMGWIDDEYLVVACECCGGGQTVVEDERC